MKTHLASRSLPIPPDFFIETPMAALQALIDTLKKEFGDDFSKLPHRNNTLLVIVQHGFVTIRSLMEAIFSLGIDPKKQIMLTTKPHTTPPAMLDYFHEQLGSNYMVFEWPKETSTGDGQTPYQRASEQSLRALFHKVCDYLLRYPGPSEIDNIIICDEGGKLLPFFIEGYRHPDLRYNKKISDYRIIGIEHTKCGLYREEIGRLPFPIINMADSYAKTQVEAEFIAKSMFINVKEKIRTITESSMLVIGVVGGGNVGSELLNFLSNAYTTISILFYDKASGILPQTKLDEKGWHNVTRVNCAEAIFTQSTVIIGCTGKDITHKECFENAWLARNPNPHIHCISASSGDREFYSLLQAMPDYRLQGIEDIHDRILSLSESKQLTIHNGGFPINFIVGEPENIPIAEIQLTRSMKLAAIVQAFKLLEVMMYQPKQARIIKLDVRYQYVIIMAFYADLIQHLDSNAPNSSAAKRSYEAKYQALETDQPSAYILIQEGSIGDVQPTLNDVVGIPYYVKTQYHSQAEQLIASQTTMIKRLAITGTTGSGKTVLGQYMLTRFGKQRGILNHTLIAETHVQWRSDLRVWAMSIDSRVNDFFKEEADSEKQHAKVIAVIQEALSQSPWCILVDNWDANTGPAIWEIQQLGRGIGILLLTSQQQSPFDEIISLNLSEGFQPEESLQLFKSVMRLSKRNNFNQAILGNESECQELLAMLNCLPLAIVQAGSYLYWKNKECNELATTPCTFNHYQNHLKNEIDIVIKKNAELCQIKANVPRVTQQASVRLSLSKTINPFSSDPNMLLWNMLCFCGFLAPTGIPQSLLKTFLLLDLPNQSEQEREQLFLVFINDAQRYSLLQVEKEPSLVDNKPGLRLHRVTQFVLRSDYWAMLEQKNHFIRLKYINTLINSIKYDNSIMQFYASNFFLVSHIKFFLETLNINTSPETREALCHLYFVLSQLECSRFKHEDALSYLNQASNLLDQSSDYMKYQIAHLSAQIYLAKNKSYSDYQLANTYLIEAENMAAKLGEKKSQASILNELARLHYDLGKYDDSLNLCNQSIAIYKDINETDTALFAYVIHDLGMAFFAMGQLDSAELHYKDSLIKKSKIYSDKKTPTIAATLLGLGQIEYVRGKFETAQKLFEQSQEISSDFFTIDKYPKLHPGIAASYNDIGCCHVMNGNLKDAFENFSIALTIYLDLANQSENMSSALVIYNLAIIAFYIKLESICARLLALSYVICSKTVGPMHERTVKIAGMMNLYKHHEEKDDLGHTKDIIEPIKSYLINAHQSHEKKAYNDDAFRPLVSCRYGFIRTINLTEPKSNEKAQQYFKQAVKFK